jgi:hypothetical protein
MCPWHASRKRWPVLAQLRQEFDAQKAVAQTKRDETYACRCGLACMCGRVVMIRSMVLVVNGL